MTGGEVSALAFFDSHSRRWKVRLEVTPVIAASLAGGLLHAEDVVDVQEAAIKAASNNDDIDGTSDEEPSTHIVYVDGKRFVCTECKMSMALFVKETDPEYGETYTCTNCRAEFQGVH